MRSTTKHQRTTQNSRLNAVQQGRRGFGRCEICRRLFSLYRGSKTRHENVCKQREERQKFKAARIQAERRTPTPQPYTPITSSPEVEFEFETRLDIMGVAMDDGACFF